MSSSLSVEKANSPTPSSPNMFSSPRPTRPLRTTNIAVRTDYKPSSFATSSHRVQAASRISQNLTDLAISDNNTNSPPVDPGASLSQVEANVMARSIKGMDGKQGNNATQTSHVLASNYGPERHFAQEPTTTQSARPVRNNPYPLKASSRQVSHTSVNQQALVSPSFDAPMVGAASQPVQKVSFQMNPKEQPQVSPALQWAPGYTNPTTHVNPYTKNATPRAPVSPRCQQALPETIHEREDPQERYELHTIIRDSIFGKVFAAIDKKTGQKVAIKLSNLQLLRSGRSVNGRPVLENPIHESAMMRKICPISLAPNFDMIGQVSELEALQPTSMQVDSIPQGEGETVDIPRRFSPSDDKIMSVPVGEKGLALGLPPLPPMHRNVLPLLAEYADGLVHWMVMPLMQGELFDEVRRIPRPSARHLQAHRRSMIKPNTAADAISPSTAVARHTQSDSKAADPTDNFNGFNHVHTAACNFSDIQRKFQQYFREMVEGLSYIHARNFCHLDFSLENILIDFDDSLKVSDFGVARELPTEGTLLPAFRHEKPGKLRYMAPEVLASQPFDGKKADSFGLGVTLFCMLTAHPPFEMPSPSDPGFALIAQGNLAHLLKLLRVDHLVTIKAYEVLNGLLCPDWTRRWSLEQVRAHGYFRDDILEDEEDTLDVVMGKSASAPVHSAPSTRPEGIPA